MAVALSNSFSTVATSTVASSTIAAVVNACFATALLVVLHWRELQIQVYHIHDM
jgi:hypothetical protein